jgi:NADH:ubiquinone oxidoreductase subunit 6 (subunit J)
MTGILEWIIFLALSLIAVITAAGMLLTMSMYRAGLALMASFVALAGLFILLGADLLAAIQIMMNVGGMLVMVLFMVMIMMDPGGEMMWDMKRDMHIRGLAAFSMTMPRGKPPAEEPSQENEQHAAQTADWTCPMHPEVSQPDPGTCPKCGMSLISRTAIANGEAEHEAVTQPQAYTCPMHPEVRQDHPGNCPKCGMALIPAQDPASAGQSDSHEGPSMSMHQQSDEQDFHTMHSGHEFNTSHMSDGDHQMNMSGHDMHTSNMSSSDHQMQMPGHGMTMSHMGMTPRQYYDMMVGMAMSTAQLPWAIALGAIAAILLIILVIQTPWSLSAGGPTQDATTMVGKLLLSRYMIAFEGAAFLILAGIAGAVIFGKREHTSAEQPTAKQTGTEEVDQQVYTCPMHPEVRQNQPGNCSKCGMTLIPAQETLASSGKNRQGEQL